MASSSSIRAKIKSKEKELSTWKKRKSKLETAKKRLDKDYDDDVSDARDYNQRIVEELENGLKGEGLGIDAVCSGIEEAKEQQVWNDEKLSSAGSATEEEIDYCKTKISDLESEIERLKDDLREAEAREWRERLAALGF